jgi:hypothetical protein
MTKTQENNIDVVQMEAHDKVIESKQNIENKQIKDKTVRSKYLNQNL